MKLAFLYSGQGAQTVGMAQELYESYPVVREVFDEASAILGYSMEELCFTENDQLNETEFTQPALLTVSVAIDRVLAEHGIQPDMVAGLSLGEYTALVKAEAIPFAEAVALVSKRGRFMSEACPTGTGKMVAVLNAERTLIEQICEEASKTDYVAPANYNTPNQVVIGGEVAGVDRAVALLEEAGVKRMMPLNVSGPFHTALLKPAAIRLGGELSQLSFKEPSIPVIGNTEARSMPRERIAALLEQQVMSPVRFDDSIRYMIDQGVDSFIEVGPGKTLRSFIKKIDKNVSVANVEDLASLQKTVDMLSKRGTV